MLAGLTVTGKAETRTETAVAAVDMRMVMPNGVDLELDD